MLKYCFVIKEEKTVPGHTPAPGLIHYLKGGGVLERLCRFQKKDVINLRDGSCLGRVIDLIFDESCGCIQQLVVGERSWFPGWLGGEQAYRIPWQAICRIGDDVILVEADPRKDGGGRGGNCD